MRLDNGSLSIIICCYNSAKRLPQTIKHIALQEVPQHINWELIIINNNSTDNTKEIAALEVNNYPVLKHRYSIIDEPTPGLSSARHKGVEVAKYDYVIFCDDDNWLEKTYVQTAYEILENNPKIAAVGGQSEAVSDVQFPDWWEDYKEGYAVGKQNQVSGNIHPRNYLWGSGLVFRKSLYIMAFKNFPSLLSDRKGNELSAGGDSEICMRFLLMGYELYYDENLSFKHYIPSNRLSWEYRKKLFLGFQRSHLILDTYSQYISIVKKSRSSIFSTLVKYILKITFASIFRKKHFYSSVHANYIFFTLGVEMEKTSPYCKPIKNFKRNAKK